MNYFESTQCWTNIPIIRSGSSMLKYALHTKMFSLLVTTLPSITNHFKQLGTYLFLYDWYFIYKQQNRANNCLKILKWINGNSPKYKNPRHNLRGYYFSQSQDNPLCTRRTFVSLHCFLKCLYLCCASLWWGDQISHEKSDHFNPSLDHESITNLIPINNFVL